MKTLLLLRHAKSSWSDPTLTDHQRPLNPRGKRDAPRIGALLKSQGMTPEAIVSSTAKRARKTAAIVAKHSGYVGEIQLTDDLYHAHPGQFVAHLQQLSDQYESVLVVGHNPGLEELLRWLTGRSERMPTAALAHIELPIVRWQELAAAPSGQLRNLWRPKELPQDQ